MNEALNLIGRILIALLFLGRAAQKLGDPTPVSDMIAALGLIFGPGVRNWALILAAYCIFTSHFHFQLRTDPWRITIMLKTGPSRTAC